VHQVVDDDADPTLVRIIINNLMDNAASYSPSPGEVRIRCKTEGDHVQLTMANRSEDLPDNLERLFEPLFRKESSRNDAETHLGIGLTLSLEAATSMGASLRARKTNAGGWIEFILAIPAADLR
ncbi:MAG: ATP-binding protein, partial [Verrucomicrobiaceae bacterium]